VYRTDQNTRNISFGYISAFRGLFYFLHQEGRFNQSLSLFNGTSSFPLY